MKGRIYISSAFTNLEYAKCKPNVNWLDNDPHFWSMPPTWGICRTDYRKVLEPDDYIFFILPKNAELPQMIYGYFKIKEKITHYEAYNKFPHKRMKNKNPNGNIIVDKLGNYNKYDFGIHRNKFDNIKNYYLVGSTKKYKFLKSHEIKILAPHFLNKLNEVFNTSKVKIFDIIGRKGRKLNYKQVNMFLDWLK